MNLFALWLLYCAYCIRHSIKALSYGEFIKSDYHPDPEYYNYG